MPVVLLVGLLETLQRRLILPLMLILLGFFVGLLSLVVAGPFAGGLSQSRNGEAGEDESRDR